MPDGGGQLDKAINGVWEMHLLSPYIDDFFATDFHHSHKDVF